VQIAPRNHFVARWTVFTTLGLAAGMFSALLLGGSIQSIVGMMLVTPILTSLVGAVLGLSQQACLRSKFARPSLWVAASGVGLGIGLAVGVVIVEQVGTLLIGHRPNVGQLGPFSRALSVCVVGLVSGVCLGAAQSLVIRRQAFNVRGWIRTSALALGVGLPASSLIVDLLFGSIRSPLGIAAFVLFAGVIFGAMSAKPMARAVSVRGSM
jgi:hypothetical protein